MLIITTKLLFSLSTIQFTIIKINQNNIVWLGQYSKNRTYKTGTHAIHQCKRGQQKKVQSTGICLSEICMYIFTFLELYHTNGIKHFLVISYIKYKINDAAIFWKKFYSFLYYILLFHRLHCCWILDKVIR